MWFWSKNKLLNSEPKYNRFLSLSVTKEDVLFYNNKKGQNEVVLIPNEIKVKIIPYKEFKNYEQIKKINPNKNTVIGFGITEKTIKSLKKTDGLVVGSAICKEISKSIKKRQNVVTNVTNIVRKLRNKIQ